MNLKNDMKQLALKFRYGLHWDKPNYPFRIMRNMIIGRTYAALGIKKYVLRGVNLQITYDCNFDCQHCLCKKMIQKERKELTVEEYKRICKEAMALGCTTFGMEGGEAFMRKDWIEVTKAFLPKYNHVMFTTNSSFLSERVIKIMKDLGVDTINISMDSGFEEEHDKFRRRKGAYKKAMEAVDLCKKHGIKTIFNMTLWKGNLYSKGFIRLLNIAKEKDLLINTMFVKATGNFSNQKEFMLDDEDITFYYQLRKVYPQVLRHLDFNFGSWGCPGVKEMMNITPYGDVFSCANGHISGGNLKKEDLNTIRNRMLKQPYWNKYGVCLLAEDKKFMKTYYPLMEGRLKPLSIDEFNKEWNKDDKEL